MEERMRRRMTSKIVRRMEERMRSKLVRRMEERMRRRMTSKICSTEDEKKDEKEDNN